MTHATEKYTETSLTFLGLFHYTCIAINYLKLVGTWAPTTKIGGDILAFNVLNVPISQLGGFQKRVWALKSKSS